MNRRFPGLTTAVRAPADDTGGAPPAKSGTGDAPPAVGSGTDAAPKVGTDGKPPVETKPAPSGLAADYWDPEAGAVRFDKLVPALNDLSKFKTDNEPRLAALAEIEKQVPASLDDYVATLPESFAKDYGAPDGFTFEVEPNDPLLAKARALAKRNNWTVDTFREVVALGAARDLAMDQALADRFVEETKKLGAKGMDRRSAMERDLVAEFGNEALTFTAGILSAKHVEMIEKLVAMAKGRGQQFTGAGREVNEGGQEELSDAEYDKMSDTQKINYARSKQKPAKAAA